MKSLIIFRHAKSNWSAHYEGDINRPITSQASKRAKATGALLKEKKINIDFALVSVALRTNQTFDAFVSGFGKKINCEIKNEIYHGRLETILGLIKKLDSKFQTVIIVSHEPTCSFLTEQLLAKVDQEISFRTATIAKIDFDINNWSEIDWMKGRLHWITRAK